jgi:hypothetical protein
MAKMNMLRAIVSLLRGRIAGGYFPMKRHTRSARAGPQDCAAKPDQAEASTPFSFLPGTGGLTPPWRPRLSTKNIYS